MLFLDDGMTISDNELEFSVSRSSGPGGQHVNKTSTRVTVRFDVGSSPSLTGAQRRLIMSRLAGRIGSDGFIAVSAQDHRSQYLNRQAAVRRLGELLSRALRRKPPRVRTTVPRHARERRIERKRRRGAVKHLRGRVRPGDD